MRKFPFLFGGTFIEAAATLCRCRCVLIFPFLFGGTFIEATEGGNYDPIGGKIPFLLGRAFIEATCIRRRRSLDRHFPSFLEGLSIRQINIPLRVTTGPFVLYIEV